MSHGRFGTAYATAVGSTDAKTYLISTFFQLHNSLLSSYNLIEVPYCISSLSLTATFRVARNACSLKNAVQPS